MNVFGRKCGVVQSFQKLASMKPLAPTQTGAPFVIAQGVVLLIFILAGIAVTRKFRPDAIYL